MTCQSCYVECQRFGKHQNGLQRFRCPQCKRTFTESHELTLGEMYAPKEKVLLAIQLLLEGNSIRSTMRITDIDQNTIMKALTLAGERCEKVLGRLIVNIPVKDVECDEIWGFIAKKEKMLTPDDDPNFGDAYTFVAVEHHSKLVLNFALGKRERG
jgi:transposase-like protein